MPTSDFTNLNNSAQRPFPDNNRLQELFRAVDTVIIKEGGVSEHKAFSDKVVLSLTAQNDIACLADLLAIETPDDQFICLCAGSYAIELHVQAKLKATIGLHHGSSIRYYKWNSDALLTKSDELLAFLSDKGLEKPLQDKLEENRRSQARQTAERKWLETAPKSFGKYWEQIAGFNQTWFPALMKELNEEFPDEQQEIIALLQTFGVTDDWTHYPYYEEIVNDILKTFEVREIIDAYLNADRNYKTRKGLGRFLCGFEFKKTRNEQLKFITDEVIIDLEKCFNYLNDQYGIEEIKKLKTEKSKFNDLNL